MPSQSSIATANLAWLASCFPAYRNFRQALKNPELVQARLLARLLAANADSAYAKRWQFSSVHTVREYQRAVPIASYDDFAPWIQRIMDGEQRVLTSEPVLMLERSSGSSGAAKYIPYTRSLRKEFQRAVGAWMLDLSKHHPALIIGSAYWSLTPLARKREVTKGGLAVGFENDTEYFGGFQRKALQTLMAVPDELARITDLDTSIYATLRFLLQAPSLAFVSVWHPSFLTILMEHLRLQSERLIADLRGGELRPPTSVSNGVLAPLKKYLRQQKTRAAHLHKVLQRKEKLSPHDLWPNLEIISCWSDAAARSAVPTLQAQFPSARIQGKGLLATEGVVSIPMVSQDGCAAAVTSHFYEFTEDESASPKLLHELELGREYGVLLTTGGGLWRYRLGDRVRVVGHYERTPLLEFIGKEGEVSDLCGEKLNSIFVGDVLNELKSERVITADFAMLAPSFDKTPRYILFLHGRMEREDLDVLLDSKLKANSHYAYCRKLGQLARPVVFRVTGNPVESFLRRSSEMGQRTGSVKPTPLHRIGGWENHFEGFLVKSGEVESGGCVQI